MLTAPTILNEQKNLSQGTTGRGKQGKEDITPARPLVHWPNRTQAQRGKKRGVEREERKNTVNCNQGIMAGTGRYEFTSVCPTKGVPPKKFTPRTAALSVGINSRT
jgi:hypothetical protein